MTSSAPRARGVLRVLLVLAPLALGVFLVLRAARTGGRAPLPSRSDPAAQPTVAALAPELGGLGYAREAAPAAPPPPPAGVPTARSFLAEYYGDTWGEVEARMLAAGAHLDVPYVFHPWEEAVAEIGASYRLSPQERSALVEQKLGWPAELTLDWVRQHFDTGRPYPLAEQDLAVLDALVADQNLEILGKAELWAASIDIALQERFQRGQFVRMPYTSLGMDSSRGFYAKGVGGLGWATGMTLTREDYPEIIGLEREIMALRKQRYERVVRHLHGRIAR